jgi:hypothetical protein
MEPSEQTALTPREYSVAHCLSLGFSNKGTATALGLTEGTVKIYVGRLAGRVGVEPRCNMRIKIALDFIAGKYRTCTAEEEYGRRHGPRRLKCPRMQEVSESAAQSPPPMAGPSEDVLAVLVARRKLNAAQQAEADMWDKVFAEKFADPDYYKRPATPRISSHLG